MEASSLACSISYCFWDALQHGSRETNRLASAYGQTGAPDLCSDLLPVLLHRGHTHLLHARSQAAAPQRLQPLPTHGSPPAAAGPGCHVPQRVQHDVHVLRVVGLREAVELGEGSRRAACRPV